MTSISAQTKLLGLLGAGTSYTKSPFLHNKAVKVLGIDQVYVNFDLPAESISAFLKIFWQMGGVGLNITKPHKTLVASLLPDCQLPSVNTLTRTPTGWLGHSTDGPGFVESLKHIDERVEDYTDVVFLGSGGAVQAVLHHLSTLMLPNLHRLTVLRRSSTQDKVITALAPRTSDPTRPMEFIIRDLSRGDLQTTLQNDSETNPQKILVVQGTSAPSQGDGLSELIPAFDEFSGTFVDMVYGHPSQIFYSLKNGTAMLIEQARLSQQLWWGHALDYATLLGALNSRA